MLLVGEEYGDSSCPNLHGDIACGAVDSSDGIVDGQAAMPIPAS
jgi:hypothetical protein